jgi:hypothetical protein
LLCFGLFLWSLGLRLILWQSDRTRLHSDPLYQYLAGFRPLMLRPLPLIAHCLWMAYGLYWALKTHKKPVSDATRLGVLALVLGTALGLLMFIFLPPL